jgi:predicted nucleic acid-binding protein
VPVPWAGLRNFLRQTVQSELAWCVAEVAVSFPQSSDAWSYFRNFLIYPLHRGIAEAAADVDRELIRVGGRLGENDTWIAGFTRYDREPVISQDAAFDHVPGLRRLHY